MGPPVDGTEPKAGPPARFSRALLWVALAALLFGILTRVLDRGRQEEAAGLIRWQPREKAAAAARSSGRPLLYDFTAAWCGPCRRLDAEGWGDREIADLVNGSYLPARVVDREREEGKNPPAVEELQRRYSVNLFPTLIVATPDGRLVARLQGFVGREKLLQFLQESSRKTP